MARLVLKGASAKSSYHSSSWQGDLHIGSIGGPKSHWSCQYGPESHSNKPGSMAQRASVARRATPPNQEPTSQDTGQTHSNKKRWQGFAGHLFINQMPSQLRQREHQPAVYLHFEQPATTPSGRGSRRGLLPEAAGFLSTEAGRLETRRGFFSSAFAGLGWTSER